jgi:uncharacterized membrane protein
MSVKKYSNKLMENKMKKSFLLYTSSAIIVLTGCKMDHENKQVNEIHYLSNIENNDRSITLDESVSKLTTTKEIYWSDIKNQIIDNHCLLCHSPTPIDPTPDNMSTMEAGLDLTNLDVVKANAAKIFARVVIDNDMPLRPYLPLDKEEKEILAKWIINGMKEGPEEN